MKKTISLILSILMTISVLACGGVSANAYTSVVFNQEYSQYYSNSNCDGTFTVPSNGIVTLNVTLPRSEYGSLRYPDLKVYKGSTQIVNEYIGEEGNYYLFLSAGTYTYNLYMDYISSIVTPIKYKFSFQPSYNNLVRPISFGTTYSYIYNNSDCLNSFSLSKDSNVTFTLTQPLENDGSAASSYLYIYDMNNAGKQIWYDYHTYTDSYNYSYTVRLAKGNYRFNYKSSDYPYDDIICYDGLTKATYKVTVTPASAPKAPVISQKVEVTNYSTFTTYDVEASFADNPAYDGVELWTKKNNGNWTLEDTAENTEYSRHTKVSIYVSSSNDYVIYYKVRAYSRYGSNKIYSPFSNVLYTKTSLKPTKPTVLAKAMKKSVKISWYKLDDVDGYVVYRSTKKKKGYKKVKTIKKNSQVSFKNKKLKSKKTYYFKVRSYKIIDNEIIYSNYSKPIKVKIK